jgi:hypothetical protein
LILKAAPTSSSFSEGALELVDGELGVVKERFLVSVLGRQLLPLFQLPPTTTFVVVLPSPLLRWRRAHQRHLLLRDLLVTEDFVVVDREEEEEAS